MAANRSKEDDKNLKILRELISQDGNKYCLDCNQRGPTYVNTTIGSFVCSKCSGMLRGLTPPHRVKSISMATFTPEEIEFIRSRGNQYCKRVWLGLYEGESVNFADEQSVRDFMSDKYEKKRYYLDSPLINGTSNGSSRTKSKGRSSSGVGNSAQLISIPSQSAKSMNNNSTPVGKVFNNLLSGNETTNSVLARPVTSHSQPLLNTVLVPPLQAPVTESVPDFPVDFSTAEIYNSSQYNSTMVNNNVMPQSAAISPPLNSFTQTNTNMSNMSAANDRYAALADLDMAFRQENMKHLVTEETNDNSIGKNPFQSTASDLFSNRNPFFNGGWSAAPAPPSVPVNPFMPSMNNGNYMNSKNPFL